MDPNEALKHLVNNARAIIALSDDDLAIALADEVLALHEWLIKGGFLPQAWVHGRENDARLF